MKLLDRYIGQAVLAGTAMVMLVLLALFSFITFLAELDVVGRGNYGTWQAAQYVLLLLPRLAYQLFPLSALLGSLLGLGLLATHNELVVMRATGVSLQRMIVAVLKAALVLMAVAVLLSEVIASNSEQYAQDMRSQALSGNIALRTQEGFWTRSENHYINVRTVISSGLLDDVHIYELDPSQRLRKVTHAARAEYREGEWYLEDVKRSEFSAERVITRHFSETIWQTLLSPQLLEVVTVKPQSLSGWGLYQYIEYLQGNELDAASYEIEFWVKVVLPFATAVMVILAVPFVFGSLRSVGIGQRIMMGTLIGIAFYLLNQAFSYVGLAYSWNPVFSAVMPTLLFLVMALVLLRRVV